MFKILNLHLRGTIKKLFKKLISIDIVDIEVYIKLIEIK